MNGSIANGLNLVHHYLNTSFTREFQCDLKSQLKNGKELQLIVDWMEIQRHCLMMFTSCGWFFDDPAGLECVQILRYAKKALVLLENIHKTELENEFARQLSTMKSMSEETPTGLEIWQELVCIQMV